MRAFRHAFSLADTVGLGVGVWARRRRSMDVLLAFETAPGPQTGSGYEQLGSVLVTGSEVCS